jgi:hypothetical protein
VDNSQSQRPGKALARLDVPGGSSTSEASEGSSGLEESDTSSDEAGGSSSSFSGGSGGGGSSSSPAGSSIDGSDSDNAGKGEEEGISLRSQLLLGHLLLLAAGNGSSSCSVSGGGAASASCRTSGGLPGAANLQLLASHLRGAGLLPRWVWWLLKQLPQRPELFERAFKRLFQEVRLSAASVEVVPALRAAFAVFGLPLLLLLLPPPFLQWWYQHA